MYVELSQVTRTIPIDIIGFCLSHCPRIREIVASAAGLNTRFELFQLDYEKDDGEQSTADRSGISSDDSLVKLKPNGIHFTQDGLDQLSLCLPNIQTLTISRGVSTSLFNCSQQITSQHAENVWSNNFIQFKKLKEVTLDIDYFAPNVTSYIILIYLVYGNGEENGLDDEAYYKFIAKGNDHQKQYTITPISSDTIHQQQQHGKTSYLIKMHFYNKLEQLLCTGYMRRNCRTAYARFHDGEL